MESKESIVFYKSFYEAIIELPKETQLDIYDAIFQKYFYSNEIELKGIAKGIFGLMIPNIDSANKRYFANIENGKKGGAPKGNQNAKKQPKNNPKTTQNNLNVNDNDNDNVNDKDSSSTTIYDFIEKNFSRLLTPVEYEEVKNWENSELTRYAIKQSILNGKYNIKYISRIIENYKKNSITTIQQAKALEETFKENIKNKKQIIKEQKPKWFDEDIEEEQDQEKIKKMEDMINGL